MSDLIEIAKAELELHQINPSYQPELWGLIEQMAARIRELEAERDQLTGELRISQAAVGHNMGVAKRIEAATIERCALMDLRQTMSD